MNTSKGLVINQVGFITAIAATSLLTSAHTAGAQSSNDSPILTPKAEQVWIAPAPVLIAPVQGQQSNQAGALTSMSAAPLAQVTSVSQLSDVQPTDWAFQALQSLVERYGVIAGYPDGKFRGNRAMTRYEFAAGLNAALDRVNELIAAGTADLVTKEDLATLQKLQEEFSAELATLRGRVDALESRTATLEANQFSTTTKLTGEAAFFLTSLFGNPNRPDSVGDVPGAFEQFLGPLSQNTTFSQRVRLNLNTSFTGKDQLLLRLQASNTQRWAASSFPTSIAPIAGYTNAGRLQAEAITTNPGLAFNNSNIILDIASYSFPLSQNANVQIIATGGKLDDFAPTLNALDYGGAALGSISEFGQRNPIYRYSGRGAGAGFNYQFSDAISLSLGYLGGNDVTAVSSAASPSSGIFNGTFGAIAQLTVRPSPNLGIGLTYVRSYFNPADVFLGSPGLDGGVGSHFAAIPLGGGPMEVNSYGLQASYRISPQFVLGGWLGLSEVLAPIGGSNPFGQQVSPPGGRASIFNFAVTLAFPDLFKKGSLGGIIVGQTPKTTYSDGILPVLFRGPNNSRNYRLIDGPPDSYHIEAFYRYPLSDNISITPGVVVVTNPEYNAESKSIILGTMRMTFTF